MHQHTNVQEIADALCTGLLQIWELKHFVSKICCAKYANLEAHQANVEYLEEKLGFDFRDPGRAKKWLVLFNGHL